MTTYKKTKKNKTYNEIFEKAYALMDEPIIEGNCGELCGYHCCRHSDTNGLRLGMYLLPLEYEYIQEEVALEFDLHRKPYYDMPPKIKKRYYIYCDDKVGCMRGLRPIQCRTYPFEPHIEDNEFSIVIGKNQIHDCPLFEMKPQWRQAYIDGVYKGWLELMKIPIIKYNTLYYSNMRIEADGIMIQYTVDTYEVVSEKVR